MIFLIDNGHGVNTPGKCSPDGSLREYKWNREIALMLENELKRHGKDARRIVTEDIDIPLNQRVQRVNNICNLYGAKNVVLVSIHINAAGADGKWHTATGWSGWVAKQSSTSSKKLAQILYDEAAARGLQGNRCVPACKYWEANFTIIAKTNCPAVLTENLFQDNREDVAFLLSEYGRNTIVDIHFNAIMKYIEYKKAHK